MGEHLKEPAASLDDPIQSLSALPAPGVKKGHLVGHALPAGAQWPVLAAPFVQALGLNPLFIPPWQIPGFDLGVLADLVPDPEAAVRAFMNPNTICP